MKRLTTLLGRIGPGARIGILLATIVGASILGSAVAGESGPTGARQPAGIADLLDDGGKIVVDTDGKPVRGPDGKPMRVAADGKTLLDSEGRPLRDKLGRKLKIRKGRKLPRAVRRIQRRTERRPGRRDGGGGRRDRPGRRPTASRPTPAPTPDARPVVVAALVNEPEGIRRGGRILMIESDPGDPRAQVRALEKHVNATGGIGGRPLAIRLVSDDATDGRTHVEHADEQARRILHPAPPLAAVAVYGRPPLLVPRLAAAGVPLLSDWAWAPARAFFDTWSDDYFAVSGIPIDAIAEPYIAALQHTGFFRKGKVGVLGWRSPWWEPGNRAMRSALARAGVKDYEEELFTADSGGHQDLARISRDAANAVVRFQLAGVKRIVGLDHAGLATMIFMLAAESRGARFVYGLNSTHAPETIAAQPTRRGQLAGAVGLGWAPLFDVPRANEPSSPAADDCRGIYARAGAHMGDRSAFGEYSALSLCQSVLAIRTAVRRSGSVSREGLRRGLEMLGSGFDSSLNMATLLGPNRHFGTAGVRAMRYHGGCTCFRYEGGLFGY